ncbi:hypothetical protein JCM6882_009681, partial [Rhodosporidiobolus microsporus]
INPGGYCISQTGPSQVTYAGETEASCMFFKRYERVASASAAVPVLRRRASLRLGKRETLTTIDVKTGKISSVEI